MPPKRSYIYTAVVLTALIIVSGLVSDPPAAAENCTTQHSTVSSAENQDKQSAETYPEDPAEPALTEAALLESGYLSDAIPLTYDDQALLRAACEEFSVPYSLALAVIEHETDFTNVVGDNGNSFGFMQIQPRWWSERMDELGETDLMNPKSNFRVGCSILGELLSRLGTEGGLTQYNAGSCGTSSYATEVMANAEKMEELLD